MTPDILHTLPRIGIIINAVGAIIFLLTSNGDAKRLINILAAMKISYGKFDSDRKEVIPQIENLPQFSFIKVNAIGDGALFGVRDVLRNVLNYAINSIKF